MIRIAFSDSGALTERCEIANLVLNTGDPSYDHDEVVPTRDWRSSPLRQAHRRAP